MKVKISSKNQNVPVEFEGKLSITFDGGSNFKFSTGMVFQALLEYKHKMERVNELIRMVDDELKKDV